MPGAALRHSFIQPFENNTRRISLLKPPAQSTTTTPFSRNTRKTISSSTITLSKNHAFLHSTCSPRASSSRALPRCHQHPNSIQGGLLIRKLQRTSVRDRRGLPLQSQGCLHHPRPKHPDGVGLNTASEIHRQRGSRRRIMPNFNHL